MALRALVRVPEMRVRVSALGSVGSDECRDEAENAGQDREQSCRDA
jgi:hypothetical protein